MIRTEEPASPNGRSNRVVSLPCGHRVYVDLDASLIGLSGPVLDHQSTCRTGQPPTFAAWFVSGRFPRGEPSALLERSSESREAMAPGQ